MKNKIRLGALAITLAFGMAVIGCDTGGGTSPDDYGKLTVNNVPDNVRTLAVYTNVNITTQREFNEFFSQHHHGTPSVRAVVIGTSSSNLSPIGTSPFNLVDRFTGIGFSQTGTFLVALSVGVSWMNEDIYFISGVQFTDGSAEIDFTDMIKQADLPW